MPPKTTKNQVIKTWFTANHDKNLTAEKVAKQINAGNNRTDITVDDLVTYLGGKEVAEIETLSKAATITAFLTEQPNYQGTAQQLATMLNTVNHRQDITFNDVNVVKKTLKNNPKMTPVVTDPQASSSLTSAAAFQAAEALVKACEGNYSKAIMALEAVHHFRLKP